MADGRSDVIAVLQELASQWSDGPPAAWENATVPQYLDAMAAWLADCEGFYEGAGSAMPADGWVILADALRASVVYE
jgi:hypothetical protein